MFVLLFQKGTPLPSTKQGRPTGPLMTALTVPLSITMTSNNRIARDSNRPCSTTARRIIDTDDTETASGAAVVVTHTPLGTRARIEVHDESDSADGQHSQYCNH